MTLGGKKMELFFEQSEMYKALQTVQKAIPARTPMNILKGVCLFLRGNELSLTATDLEMGIRTYTEVRGAEDGSIILPERFVEIIRSLPPGEVHMRVDNETATVKYEDIVFELNGFPTEEFPLFPEKGDGVDVALPGFVLTNMLQKTLFAVSTDQSKPAFTGVNFHMEDNNLRLTSSDTFRLALITEKIKDMDVAAQDFIVPAKALRELVRVVKDEELVTLNIFKGMAIFSFAYTSLATSLLSEKFPNISRVIPEDAFTVVTVNKNLFEMALSRAALLADSEIHTVTLQVEDSQINSHSLSTFGTNTENIPLKTFEGEEVTLIMNIKFINDVLKVIPEAEIKMRFKGKTGPCVIEPLTDMDYLYLALPIKPE